MKFLFFDTECATCHNGAKICEFGYVLTDEDLNVISEDNLLINPKASFCTYSLRRAGIILAYPEGVYYSNPTLPHRYETIKSLLTDPEVMPVGFSCDNDARFLLSDFRRWRLEPFDFDYIDVMLLFKEGLKRETALSLDAIYAETGGEEIAHHEAKNDSLMTLCVLKYYLRESGDTIADLPYRRFAIGEVFGGRIIVGGRPFRYSATDKLTSLNRRVLKEFIDEKPVSEGVLGGKKFCFDKAFERDNFFSVLKAIDLITDLGGVYTLVIAEADYLVYKKAQNRFSLSRKKRRGSKVISLGDLASMLGVSEDVFISENIDVDAILGKLEKNREWYARYIAKKSR